MAISKRAERHSAELVAYCIEKKVEQFRLYGVVTETCARAQRDPTPEHIEALCAARDAHHRSGARVLDSMILCCLIEALLAVGDVRRAEAALQEADQFVDLSGEHLLLSDLRKLEGHIALKQPEADRRRAETCFLKSIEIAHGQGSRLLELRAVTDLARLRRDTGSPTDLRAAAGADPRHGRRWEGYKGYLQGARAAGGNRVIKLSRLTWPHGFVIR